MQLLIPALVIFLLAFAGLSLGIMAGRKGITGGCGSKEGKLAHLACSCGGNVDKMKACNNDVAVEVICPDQDPEKYQQLLNDLEQHS
jgi:hypothetical protein